MSSFTAPISIYNMCSQSIEQLKRYRRGGVMAYIYHISPLYAFILQKMKMDDWFDSPSFNCTCFIPNREYSVLHLKYFIENLDYNNAQKIISATVLPERITSSILKNKEIIPTLGKFYEITYEEGYVNGLKIEYEQYLDNGNVFILNGLMSPEC